MKIYSDAVQVLNLRDHTKIDLTLDRIQSACDTIGNPELDIPTIHIAGTNGKGSTAAFIESGLRSNGYKVGLFTSPHLVDVRERIQFNRELIDEDLFSSLIERHENIVSKFGLTYFEALTLIGFSAFKEENVDIAIIETGLGGRFDSTNICQPIQTVITSIDYDHQQYLGETLLDIAGEKCGIIKEGVALVTTNSNDSSVMSLIQSTADAKGVTCHFAAADDIKFPLGLAGSHQQENAAIAYKCLKNLKEIGFKLNNLEAAFANVSWPARLEQISKDPIVIIDGAHNSEGAMALREHIERAYSDKESVILFAGLKNKDLEGMIRILDDVVSRWVFTRGRDHQFESPSRLKEYVESDRAEVSETVEEGLTLTIKNKNEVLIVAGSLYLLGEVKKIFEGNTYESSNKTTPQATTITNA